jgi:hypothetical protein
LIIFTLIICMKSALMGALDAGDTKALFKGCQLQQDAQFCRRQSLEHSGAFNFAVKAAETLVLECPGKPRCPSRNIVLLRPLLMIWWQSRQALSKADPEMFE